MFLFILILFIIGFYAFGKSSNFEDEDFMMMNYFYDDEFYEDDL